MLAIPGQGYYYLGPLCILPHRIIILSGASSVGKTTFSNDWCKQHPEYRQVQEIARQIMKDKSLTRADLKSFLTSDNGRFLEFQSNIFVGQNLRESELVGENNPFITDRGPDPLVFVEQHIGHDSALKLAELPAAKECLQRYRSNNCVVIIVCPLEEIEDDNVRIVPTNEEQLQYTEFLKTLLQELSVPYKYCDKTDRHERIQWLEDIVLTCKLSRNV